jgi:hypothetical protein
MAASYHDEKSSQRVKQHRNCGAVSLLLLLTRILRLWIESQYRVCANVLVLFERVIATPLQGWRPLIMIRSRRSASHSAATAGL